MPNSSEKWSFRSRTFQKSSNFMMTKYWPPSNRLEVDVAACNQIREAANSCSIVLLKSQSLLTKKSPVWPLLKSFLTRNRWIWWTAPWSAMRAGRMTRTSASLLFCGKETLCLKETFRSLRLLWELITTSLSDCTMTWRQTNLITSTVRKSEEGICNLILWKSTSATK